MDSNSARQALACAERPLAQQWATQAEDLVTIVGASHDPRAVGVSASVCDISLIICNITNLDSAGIANLAELRPLVAMRCTPQRLTSVLATGPRAVVGIEDDHRLNDAIKAVLAGKTWLSPSLREAASNAAFTLGRTNRRPRGVLTARQAEVVEALSANPDLTQAGLARHLNMSVHTLTDHLRKLRATYNVARTAALPAAIAAARVRDVA